MEDNKDQWQRVKTLFGAVMERAPEERDAYLRKAAGDDRQLLEAVQALLVSSETEGTMHNVIRDAASGLSGAHDDVIDHYEIEELIGEGGMGDVYLAHRSDGAFDQNVAIKVLGIRRPGNDLVRRFQAERQILATLEHPNIARLIDGGETAKGVPYLVMEYVDGKAITEYCDENRLGTRERLEIFLKVCAAIQHAHQSLVIHRDIKPGNILVTADGEPKLLDFGIAKLLDPQLTQHTLIETMDSARLMTPRHASPEQIRGGKITVATDVYSLGVLLYELLSGLFPYEFTSSRAAEVEKAICDTDPLRPSARLTQTGNADTETAEKIAAAHRARVSELARQIGGDLDTIVLTAMQKEPARRYATVSDLAEDIQLYLQFRPVRAQRDSGWYRATRFARRNRFPVSVASAATVVVVAATTLAFGRVSAERDLAEVERQKAEAISDFMQGIFQVSDPAESRGEAISARQLLEEGARRIETELTEQPDTQATMMRVVGETYYGLGDWEAAEEFMNKTLDRIGDQQNGNHPEAATAKLILGFVNDMRGEFDTADALISDSLRIREELYGRQHFDTVEAISAKATLAEKAGDFVAAEGYHKETLSLSRQIAEGDHEFVAESMTKLAGFYRIVGRNDEAEPLLLDALEMQNRLYGGEHPELSDTKRQLAGLYRDTRRYRESEELYLVVLDERERMLGPDHIEVAHAWNSYSQLLADMKEYDRAIDAHQNFIDTLERGTDGPHPSFGAAYNNFAVMLKQQGKIDEALKYYQLSIDMQDAVDLPPRHPNRSFPLGGMANAYLTQKRYQESAELARTVLDMRREHFPESHRLVSEVKNILGRALTGTGEYAESEQWLMDAYTSFLSEYGEAHPGVSLAAWNLAELFKEQGDTESEQKWRDIEANALAAEKAALEDAA